MCPSVCTQKEKDCTQCEVYMEKDPQQFLEVLVSVLQAMNMENCSRPPPRLARDGAGPSDGDGPTGSARPPRLPRPHITSTAQNHALAQVLSDGLSSGAPPG